MGLKILPYGAEKTMPSQSSLQAIKTLRALYLFSEKRNLDFVLLILSEKQNLKSKTLFTNSGRCGSFTVVFATCLFGICGSNGFSMQLYFLRIFSFKISVTNRNVSSVCCRTVLSSMFRVHFGSREGAEG